MIKTNIALRIITALLNVEAVIEVDILEDISFNIFTNKYVVKIQDYYLDGTVRNPIDGSRSIYLDYLTVTTQSGNTLLEKLKQATLVYLQTNLPYGSSSADWEIV